MSKWLWYLNRHNCFTFLHRNLLEGTIFNCGDLRHDTPDEMVVEWIVNQEACQVGDVIRMPNGDVLSILPEAQA